MAELEDLRDTAEEAVLDLLRLARQLLRREATPGHVRALYLDPAAALMSEFEARAILASAGDNDALAELRRIVAALEWLRRRLAWEAAG